MELLKTLHINSSFIEALSQIPSYVKFLKEIRSTKRMLDDNATVAITEECKAIFSKKSSSKTQKPREFLDTLFYRKFNHRQCDLGEIIILMPLSI